VSKDCYVVKLSYPLSERYRADATGLDRLRYSTLAQTDGCVRVLRASNRNDLGAGLTFDIFLPIAKWDIPRAQFFRSQDVGLARRQLKDGTVSD